MKNSSGTIGNRTRDIPNCSAVPQPTAPPRALKQGQLIKHLIWQPCVELSCKNALVHELLYEIDWLSLNSVSVGSRSALYENVFGSQLQ